MVGTAKVGSAYRKLCHKLTEGEPDEKKRKVDAKQQERNAQKKKLLESFQRQRAVLKAEKAQAKATASVAAKKKAEPNRKRVSFSPGT